jgi:hypothetical protein
MEAVKTKKQKEITGKGKKQSKELSKLGQWMKEHPHR